MSWELVKFKARRRVEEALDVIADYLYREEKLDEEPEDRLESYLEKKRRGLIEGTAFSRDAYTYGGYSGHSRTCGSPTDGECKGDEREYRGADRSSELKDV